jgi:hypothetical protein
MYRTIDCGERRPVSSNAMVSQRLKVGREPQFQLIESMSRHSMHRGIRAAPAVLQIPPDARSVISGLPVGSGWKSLKRAAFEPATAIPGTC